MPRMSQRRGGVTALPTLDPALEGGRCWAALLCRIILEKDTLYPLHRRLEGSQGRSERLRKISSLPEFEPQTVQTVASRCTDGVTLAAL